MRLLAMLMTAGVAGLAAEAPAAAQGLPVVSVAPAERIPHDRKVRARVRLPGYDGWGAIEIRGQSSGSFQKKSFALELRTRSGKDQDAPLLGMPADDDWVLYAAHNDKTLMRNVVAYSAARAMGRWAASTRFVELRLRGRYHGIYVLMERPELNDARVSVPGAGPTGAYLFEFTFPFQATRKGPHFLTPIRRRPIVWEDPERADLSAAEARYTRRLVAGVERALYSGRRGAWKTVLDPGAAVDYVLTQELFRNVDAFHASTYLTKPASGLLRLGPVWDFDLSSDNTRNADSHLIAGWLTASRDWASELHRDRSFRRALGRRWAALRAAGLRRDVLREIDRSQRLLRPHVGRQFRRWPVLDRLVWPNAVARGSHEAEVEALRTWLSRRMRWIDAATGYAPPTGR